MGWAAHEPRPGRLRLTRAAQGDPVARYYDRNTLRFLVFGGGTRALSMHRELWAPGVESSAEAKRFVNRLLAEQLAELEAEAPTVLDLGCGVGGTLFHLAEARPGSRMHGVTISPRQHRLALALARRRGLQDRCVVHLADFERVRLGVRADFTLAVESFAHAKRAGAFLATAYEHLAPGGRLVIVDDFLAREEGDLPPDQRHIVGLLRAGWRLSNLATVDACRTAASEAGFLVGEDVDLTPMIRPGRPRDRAIALLSPWFRRAGLISVPFFANMIGGDALQTGLREGFVRYRMMTLEKP